jgi:hypothetical protein
MFKDNANYKLSYTNLSHGKATILSNLSTSTAMFTNTHGTPDGMFESDGYVGQTAEATHFITWGEFKTATDTQTPSLKYAAVFAYACSTLAGSLDPNLTFNLRDVNSFYIGFTETIFPWSRDDAHHTTSAVSFGKHIQRIQIRLREGDSIAQALANAEKGYPVATAVDAQGNVTSKATATLIGDPNSTLIYVYLTSTERNQMPNKIYKQWYYIYS